MKNTELYEILIQIVESKASTSKGLKTQLKSGKEVKVKYDEILTDLKNLHRISKRRCANCDRYCSTPYKSEGRCVEPYPNIRSAHDSCSLWTKRKREPYPWEDGYVKRADPNAKTREEFLASRPKARRQG